jgi:hypothetical protein
VCTVGGRFAQQMSVFVSCCIARCVVQQPATQLHRTGTGVAVRGWRFRPACSFAVKCFKPQQAAALLVALGVGSSLSDQTYLHRFAMLQHVSATAIHLLHPPCIVRTSTG